MRRSDLPFSVDLILVNEYRGSNIQALRLTVHDQPIGLASLLVPTVSDQVKLTLIFGNPHFDKPFNNQHSQNCHT